MAQPPPPAFVDTLHARGVTPISVGRVIVATWRPHEATVLAAIQELGLELQVIFNKGAVMVLPMNVSKATGFAAALKQMALSPHEAVGVGDAENDHAFLTMCECSVAVSNALPAVKQTADLTTRGDHGDGVAELIDQMVADDLRGLESTLIRHDLRLGTSRDGQPVMLSPYGPGVLIAGSSARSRSAVAAALLDQLTQRRYQSCILDPAALGGTPQAISVGDQDHAPTTKEVIEILVKGETNVVVDLTAVKVSDRAAFSASLFPTLLEVRARTGRPHWIVVNEAQQLLPAGRLWRWGRKPTRASGCCSSANIPSSSIPPPWPGWASSSWWAGNRSRRLRRFVRRWPLLPHPSIPSSWPPMRSCYGGGTSNPSSRGSTPSLARLTSPTRKRASEGEAE